MSFFSRTTFLSRGFTLLEILVVLAIFSLLSSIVLSSLNVARVKARDIERITNARQVGTALGLYHVDHELYPSGGTNGWRDIGGCHAGYPDLDDVLTPDYISRLVTDPLYPSDPDRCAWYQVRNGGTGYIITFQPEESTRLDDDMDCYEPETWYCVGFNF